MPISTEFGNRILTKLPEIAETFGTPFHIYDEKGIIKGGEKLKGLFSWNPGFKEFFAVKALPNKRILQIMKNLGFGFDCSSIAELHLSRAVGATPDDIMFTSNNTSEEELKISFESGGCILNLDDICLIDKVGDFPELISFRYNPGPLRDGNEIIGKPVEAKYGIRSDQIVDAYKYAIERGAKRFSLHTMVCSNVLDYRYMTDTVSMLLDVTQIVSDELGIKIEIINTGGGIGIPYHPDESAFDLESFANDSRKLLESFALKNGYMPKIFMELGRYITGPHGVLVTKVLNRMSKYREYVGVDASMSSLMRPGIYGAYHHITVMGKSNGNEEVVDVVGSLCENNDKFAVGRNLPQVESGDIIIIHDTGAHGHAMGFNYNGILRPKELLLRADGNVELIRREETLDDHFSSLNFEEKILSFNGTSQSDLAHLTNINN